MSGIYPYYQSASPLLEAIKTPFTDPNAAHQPNYDLFWLDQPQSAWPDPGGVNTVDTMAPPVNMPSPEEFGAEIGPYIQELNSAMGFQDQAGQFADQLAPYFEDLISAQVTPQQVSGELQPYLQEIQGSQVTPQQITGALQPYLEQIQSGQLNPQQISGELLPYLEQIQSGQLSPQQFAGQITPYLEQIQGGQNQVASQLIPYLEQIQGMLGQQNSGMLGQQITPQPVGAPVPFTPPPLTQSTTPPPLTQTYTPPPIETGSAQKPAPKPISKSEGNILELKMLQEIAKGVTPGSNRGMQLSSQIDQLKKKGTLDLSHWSPVNVYGNYFDR